MRRSRPYQDLGLGGFCRQRARKNKASDAETFAFYRNCKKEGQRSQAERVRWRIIDSGVGGGGQATSLTGPCRPSPGSYSVLFMLGKRSLTDCSKEKIVAGSGVAVHMEGYCPGKTKSPNTTDIWLPPVSSKEGLPNYIKEVTSIY